MDSPEITASAAIKASTLVLGYSGEDWDRFLIISVGLAAMVAVAVGFSTAGSIIAHKREAKAAEGQLEIFKQSVAAKVADAKDEGIRAGRDAADALASAAEANARTREAELALERIRLPRTISLDQEKDLSVKLAKFKGLHIDLVGIGQSTEQAQFINKLSEVFSGEPISWKVNQVTVVAGVTAQGVIISVRPSSDPEITDAAATLVLTLRSAGIAAAVAEWPGGWDQQAPFSQGVLNNQADLRVAIGSKPL